MQLAIIAAVALLAATAPQQEAEQEKAGLDFGAHAELSYVSTGGNTEMQTFASKLEFRCEGDPDSLFVGASGVFSRSEGKETSNKFLLESRWERHWSDGLFFFVSGEYLSDRFSGYDYRVYIGPGLGFTLLESETQELRGLLSVNIARDKYAFEELEALNYGSLRAEVGWIWAATERIKLKQDADYSFSFEETDRYFANSTSAIEVRAAGNVSLGVSYSLSYQGILPEGAKEKLDTTFFTSLIFDF